MSEERRRLTGKETVEGRPVGFGTNPPTVGSTKAYKGKNTFRMMNPEFEEYITIPLEVTREQGMEMVD